MELECLSVLLLVVSASSRCSQAAAASAPDGLDCDAASVCLAPQQLRHLKDSYGDLTQDPAVTWLLGFLFVTVISGASCLGLLLVPGGDNLWHNGLEGLALGSLLASALFHLVPHAFELVGEDRDHHYLDQSLLVFAGIQLFFLSERLLVLLADHLYPSSPPPPAAPTGPLQVPASNNNLALMVVVGDAVHNFIDGLSLGAALADSHLTGLSIGLAILFEEIPHELGDFAILVASGMSRRRAALVNLASASTCYLGTAAGIWLGQASARHAASIFALAAGMFLYISLFSILGELEARFNAARRSGRGLGHALHVLLLQNLGIGLGIASLYHLAKFDESAITLFINKHALS
ncbi:Metal cation symporter ZIP8 [Halotydeus destructor]|nr:Metal cation symporter ZIP8 [Halotydeus destructor]